MNAERRDWLRYRVLITALMPLLGAYTAWQALQNRDGRYRRERFGRYRPGKPADLWLHAASVGEVHAAAPLVKHLSLRYPDQQLLVTTVTPSGARAVRDRLPASVRHAYLPLDRPRAVSAFLRRFRPRCGLIMETELWPCLFKACSDAGTPLAIVNGRLSPRTLGAAAWVRRLYARSLARTACVLARSDSDRLNYIRLGARRETTRSVGNIKFAVLEPDRPVAPIELGRPYAVAASTRDGEEKMVVRAWRAAGRDDHLLVIVPRHPKRLSAILRDLKGLRLAVRSRDEAVSGETEIYIADTFGELGHFIAGAVLVFMGGSLVPKGGQNLLEPAALGKAVIVGPHMENFQSETALLKEQAAICQIASEGELAGAFRRFLQEPAIRESMGEAARRTVQERCDIAERYLDELETCLPEVFRRQATA
ncbi:3-deoxy-D-manno-octulosonic acid transferase [Thiohalomonas denitrificans]|uniref:3-deoxy-D-manno-octulosonic acid transferase n=1 Tax=Thiohalomonas denitrificans TaxID=415747 RepID=A0A1G5PRF6_9GAMM|nr:3-deoxy-D-manno-octulosonic acid transferase [Thiohalomonas denitrificans]SCZ51926.1 3-deoxy-D-manno-octulosonic-acid transferase [Thiohalomonas denitrificans]